VYLRHTRRRKDGKTHVYWRLVRSVRRGRKVVQQTVAQLGELDGEGRARAQELARSIAGRTSETCQGQLFDRAEASGSVAVKLDGVRLERSRSFGAVWLGWILWRALKLDEQCEELLASKRETVGWAEVIAILVIGRLCEPSSELYVAEQWYRTTALEDLLGVAVEDIYDERLYRALDRLLPHKEGLEKHLVKRLGELFDLDYDLLLYDVTSTYFEGVADPAIAKRGYSRDRRPDCVQVNIALVVSREGMPLGYEIFAGNTTDVTTVQPVVEKMEDRFGKVNRVWSIRHLSIRQPDSLIAIFQKKQHLAKNPRQIPAIDLVDYQEERKLGVVQRLLPDASEDAGHDGVSDVARDLVRERAQALDELLVGEVGVEGDQLDPVAEARADLLERAPGFAGSGRAVEDQVLRQIRLDR
jgi:hypothetical protein